MKINIVEAADKLAFNAVKEELLSGLYDDYKTEDDLYKEEEETLIFKEGVQNLYDFYYDYFYGIMYECSEEEPINQLEYE